MRTLPRSLDVFRGLSESALQLMVSAAETVSFAAEAEVFREGAAADALFILRSGSVRITVRPPGAGIPVVVARLAAPAVVGERGLLGGVRGASVVTDTPCVVLKLDRGMMQELPGDDSSIRSWLDAVLTGVLRQAPDLAPEGDEGIRILGHRDYVGGLWEELGRLQLDFLVAQGLRPSHCLLDIGCGALRGGVHFIRYLEPGNYLGLDKEGTLVELGIAEELGVAAYEQKRPAFVISATFEFQKLHRRPDLSLAHSLFTHLTPADIRLCLSNLRHVVAAGHRLYATFFAGDSSANRPRSHSLVGFLYPETQMARFNAETGWRPLYLGDWKNPRGLMMMRYDAA